MLPRNRTVSSALGLVVVAGAVGWIAGSQIVSPAEAASRADAPKPSLITVAVEERVLSADIIARGSIGFDDPITLSLGGSTGDPEAKPIVTFIAPEGTELKEGSVAVEIAGRPVILLVGEIDVYRDMRPGSEGLDVEQLEQALVRLGFLAKADSTWDNATGAAIQAMYAAVGYEANTTTDSELASLKAAREYVRSASQALSDAEKAIAAAGDVSASALLAAQAAVAGAQDAVALAQAQRTAAIAAANGALDEANAALSSAESAVTLAESRLAEAEAGIHPDTGLPPTPSELAQLESDVAVAEVALVAAHTQVTIATNAVTTTTIEHDSYVASAQRTLGIAQAQLTELQTPGDLTALYRARDAARRDLQSANEELIKIEARIGTWLPSGEIIFLPSMPVQVVDVIAKRGDILSGPFITVSGADIAMIVSLQESDARHLTVGDQVIIDEPELLAEPVDARIAEIPEASPSGRVQMKVELETLPPEIIGANVRVRIPIESTSGAVLVVPAAALSAIANGDTRVEVEDPSHPGDTRFVTVITGLAADGVVEVHPVDGSLVQGDRVVVGYADIGPDVKPSPTVG
ncbi:MAG: hypothetical protein JW722_07465 [Demequinaceae bacterium]|nr:hypothetical protein [Demequinaceae bacterium]